MSYTTVINVRTETGVKKQVKAIAEKLGLSLSAIINAYLKQLARTRTVNFSLAEEPTDYLVSMLKESEKDIRENKVSPTFDKTSDAIKWLGNKNRRYAKN